MNNQCHSRKTTHRRRGTSLVEVVVSTMLVGVVIVASLKTVGAVFKTWRSGADLSNDVQVCQQLMAEIMQSRYVEPGGTNTFGLEAPESSTVRTAWDDVDDYNGWSAAPQTKTGTLLTGYTGWTMQVSVRYVDPASPTAAGSVNPVDDKGLKRISVKAIRPTGQQTTMTALRSRWGILEQEPSVGAAYVTGASASLQVGSETPVFGGASLTNYAKDQ
jgi:Tfp pilus assembly protein PilV